MLTLAPITTFLTLLCILAGVAAGQWMNVPLALVFNAAVVRA